MTMLLTYKYRLNPEKRQHRALERILEQQRQLYNAALCERIECYRKTGKSISEVDQSRSLTQIRADDPAFALVQRRIQRGTLKRLDRAYKAFFRRAKEGAGASSGFPKFKGREHFDGFAFDAFAQITFKDGGLWFAGMPGKLRINLDRPLPETPHEKTGEMGVWIKNVWFKREGLIWYVGFQVPAPVRENRNGLGKGAIGADWGTSVLAHLSSGEIVPNPRHGEALAQDLARTQRSVSRKAKGSKQRLKARRHLQAVQRKIANRRRNSLDKLSARLVKNFGTIAIEDIAVKGLMDAERPGETLPEFVKTRRNREVLDTAPYLLRQMLTYKAQREGATLIVVPSTNTTQECFWCGGLHFKELTDATHVCTRPGPYFNLKAPRKLNAARVILKRALACVPAPLRGAGRNAPIKNHRGGPVPGGLSGSSPVVRNARTSARRPGNTEAEQSAPGRRGVETPPLPHARGRDPKVRGSPGW